MVEYRLYEIQSRSDSRDAHRSAFGGNGRAPGRDTDTGTGARRGAGRRQPRGSLATGAMAHRSLQDRHFSNRRRYPRLVSGDRCRGSDGRTAAAPEFLRGGGPRTETCRRIERARGAYRYTGRDTVHYGAANQLLREALEKRGASVQEIATYRWALPADTQPLNQLLDALARSSVDAVVFTSAVQIHNLYAVAEKSGRASELADQLNRLVIASIGPVCSRALREHGVTPSFEANPPKLGPLVAGLDEALSVHRRQ